ncbi:hypothetical protein BOX15_Mlig003506g1, partial [Macrostomum lignano]
TKKYIMTTKLFGKDLKEYEDIDVDELLAKLTPEEIDELNSELDPDNSLLPPSQRCRNQTDKEPTGPFDRDRLIKFLRDQAAKEKDWEEAVPYEKKTRGKVFVPKEQSVKAFSDQDLADMGLDPETEDVLRNASEEEIVDLAAALGFSSIMNQVQYWDSVKNSGQSLEGGFTATAKSELIKAMADEPPNPTDLNDSIRRLESDAADLQDLNLNNLREISGQDWDRLWTALGKNTKLKKLQAANCGLTDAKAAGLLTALETNKTLETLCLDSNILTGPYIVKLFSAIGNQGRIRELRLSNQRQRVFGVQIEMEILRLVGENETLIRLGIDLQIAEAKVRVQDRVQRNMDKATRLARAS